MDLCIFFKWRAVICIYAYFFASSKALSISLKNSLPLHAGVSWEPSEKKYVLNMLCWKRHVLSSFLSKLSCPPLPSVAWRWCSESQTWAGAAWWSVAPLALPKVFASTLVRSCAKSLSCLCTNVPGSAKKHLTSPGCGNWDTCSTVLSSPFAWFLHGS